MPADVDADKLPNDWETTYFGSTTAAGALADSDGDGGSNFDEYVAGTLPNNASDRLTPAVTLDPGGMIRISAGGKAGRHYRLQRSPDLSAWTDVDDSGLLSGDQPLNFCNQRRRAAFSSASMSPCRKRHSSMKKLLASLVLSGFCALQLAGAAESRPNIVVILADDFGYGDVQCYNPERGRIPTPGIDGLAAQGMRFTDAHSSSGVCSPSRYTLLTGRYHWRTRLHSGIVGVFGDPLIAKNRLTIGGLAKQHDYRTAAIGKWHLGWEWSVTPAQRKLLLPARKGGGDDEAAPENPKSGAGEEHLAAWRDAFSKPIANGPTARGFDTYFGTDVPNWPPYCFIENDRTVGIPSEFLPAENFKNHLASLPGPAVKDWKLEAILPALGDRASAFIADAARQPEPFLLYLALTAPHTPLAVTAEWKGASGLNTYADFVMETDAVVGRVIEALEKSGAAGRTLVVFTSDNGCAPYIDVNELEALGHYPSGPLRG